MNSLMVPGSWVDRDKNVLQILLMVSMYRDNCQRRIIQVCSLFWQRKPNHKVTLKPSTGLLFHLPRKCLNLRSSLFRRSITHWMLTESWPPFRQQYIMIFICTSLTFLGLWELGWDQVLSFKVNQINEVNHIIFLSFFSHLLGRDELLSRGIW